MATIRYTGQSTAVVQVDTVTIGGTPATDSTFTITATGENGDTYALTVISGTTDVDVAATTIAAAWNASSHYLLTPVTAAGVGGASGEMTLTADTAGQPFDILSTPVAKTDGAGSPTIARAATTASKGPFDWNDVDNWDLGVIPLDNDDIILDGITVLYGLNQTAPANDTPATLIIKNSQVSQNPPAGVAPAYLTFAGTTGSVEIGDNFNPGTLAQATPVMFDNGTSTQRIIIHGSGTNSTSTLPAVWLRQNASDARLEVRGGTVGLGYYDETVQVDSISVTGGSLYAGKGLTVTASGIVEVSGGLLDNQSPLTNEITWRVTAGTVNLRDSIADAASILYFDGGVFNSWANLPIVNMNGGTLNTTDLDISVKSGITTLNQRGGQVNYNSSKTITTATIYSGTLDLTGTNLAKVITNLLMGRGAIFKSNAATTTLTNDILFTTDDASGVRTVSVA